MKIWIIGLMVLMLAGVVSAEAIRINEIELNPAGSDSGNEWVELYSPNGINLTGYSLVNSDEEEIILEGVFSGYYVVNFNGQWLDNSDEKVSLLRNGTLVHETLTFSDSFNDGRTWNFCGLEWNFKDSTMGEDNGCSQMCLGDFNLDGNVDGVDLANLLSNWGGRSNDLSGNGFVGAEDLNLLLANWGTCSIDDN